MAEGEKKKSGLGVGCIIALCVGVGMIFVFGILAAIAVPGFMAYVRNSKVAEAKTELKILVDGAIAYQQGNGHYLEMPNGARLGPEVNQSTVGLKYLPTAEDLDKSPWKELRFKPNTPHYFSYFYTTQTTAAGTIVQITASASLSSECDAVYYVIIGENGPSPILEGDASLCNPVGSGK